MTVRPGEARPTLAARALRVPVPATMAMAARARALRDAGASVISLSIGEPDFPTPEHAIAAAAAAARRGETRYPPLGGTPALKAAIARKFERDQGLAYRPDEIVVCNGGKQVIFNAFLATMEPGDEVVIPTPCWNAYPLVVDLLDGAPVFAPCAAADGFRLSPDALDRAITPRTRWVTLNFPNNPTGATCSADELAAIAAVLRRHPHVWALSDDMYEHLVHDGAHHTLAAVAPDLRDRVLTMGGVSKTYAMTGWRIGWGAGPARLIAAMTNMQGQATAGVSSVGQAAAAAVLDGPQDMVAAQAAIYRDRRDLVVAACNAMPGVRCHTPAGAFYVFADIAGCLDRVTPAGAILRTDEDFATALLNEAGVAVVHGAAFGMSPYVRLSYATDDDSLAEAMRRMTAFTASMR